jgi:hypothetical protein
MQLKLAAGLCHLIGQRKREIVGVSRSAEDLPRLHRSRILFGKMVRT